VLLRTPVVPIEHHRIAVYYAFGIYLFIRQA
jgi:hypothetical protein